MNHYTTFYQVKKDYRFACAFHSTRKLFINATSFQKKKKKKGGKKFPIVSLDFFPALLVCFPPPSRNSLSFDFAGTFHFD